MNPSSPVRESPQQRRERRRGARPDAERSAEVRQASARGRSGRRWQAPQRERERAARKHSLQFDRWARRRGAGERDVARALRLPPRTLRRWKQQWKEERLKARPRGRPPARSSRAERNAVHDLLRLAGPALPLAALRAQFPQMPCAELKRLVRRFRRKRRPRERTKLRLYWFRPGSVWAADFVENVGGLEWVLSVRDLASRKQLLWRSVPAPSAEFVIAAYEELFREHGAPLVFKSDNGSAFIAESTRELLDRWGVIPLFSPPRRPQYNGGVERGGGILKGYTRQAAESAGRPGVCRVCDLEQARQLANALTRPWGHRGPSPDEVWRAREPIADDQRRQFHAELARARHAACEEMEYPPDQPLTRAQAARRDRRAVQASLIGLRYLQIVPRHDRLLRQPPLPSPTAPDASLGAEKPPTDSAPPAKKPCTLTTAAAPEDSRINPESNPPAHPEPALFRVLRRLITPPQKLKKAAKIP